MGKDHEFLEAARNGNITTVEKVLNQKAKRTGPLASLRRGPGANVQDSSGYSALHHAALNGHSDIARLLLQHDASPNLPDSRGSSPLHLAAWAGHQDIVKLFLTHGNRPANPNLQTIENETPLHCAAQHGHTGALTTLLAHGADPNVTNNRYETPLDLAAQYGRLQVVQMLIRAHPELLLPFKLHSTHRNHCKGGVNNVSNVFSHSPLHLASRNGHKNVVEVLLSAGVNVNLLTPSGTALHEAALCGKDNVVRILLNFGADLEATDCENRTALDILEEFPPHVTKGIISVINNHRNSILYDSESDDIQRDNLMLHHYNHKNEANPTATTPMSLDSSYDRGSSSPVQNYCYSHHDITTSPSSSMGSLGPPSPTPQRPRASTAPKKPPRRNLSISPTHLSSSSPGGGSSDNNVYGKIIKSPNYQPAPQLQQNRQHYNYLSMDGGSGSGEKTSPKPSKYEYVYMAKTGPEIINRTNDHNQYVQMNVGGNVGVNRPQQQQQQIIPIPAPRNLITVNYENTTLKSYNPNRKLKRNRDNYESFNIDFNKEKAFNDNTENYPQSPTNYKQPPTPEHPPPAPAQAEKCIHDCIRPLSQEYKRRSGLLMMIESGTSPQDFILQQQLKQRTDSQSSNESISTDLSTDCVEEFIGDAPFAGLFKGSTVNLCGNNNFSSCQQMQYLNQLLMKTSSPLKQYGPLPTTIDMKFKHKEQKRSLSFNDVLDNYNNGSGCDDGNGAGGADDDDEDDEILSPFNEEEAWAKISEIMESFGSGILNNHDENGDDCGDGDNSINSNQNIIELIEILKENQLETLSNILIDNGYDHMQFINGIIDDSDIIAMNIPELDRNRFNEFITANLPLAKSLPILHDTDLPYNDDGLHLNNGNTQLSVDQWLHSINLSEYCDVFRKHLYTNMESVFRVWEIELQTVLEIHKIGHRKRILHSVENNRKNFPFNYSTKKNLSNNGKTSIDELNDDLNSLKANIMELNDDINNKKNSNMKKPLTTITNTLTTPAPASGAPVTTTTTTTTTNRQPPIRHSNKKNRPAPKPPIKQPQQTSLEIRAPSELLLGLPSNLRTKWRHSAASLVNDVVKYDVYYLGSTVVKELRGTESTRKSIQKLKRDSTTNKQQLATNEIQKKRPVRLAISQRGVAFIDIESQKRICEHEIRNINCACQDADDLSHFAYITKDNENNLKTTHYCHVFNVDSMDLATEIILTLGQAFEVAYQLALRASDTVTADQSKNS